MTTRAAGAPILTVALIGLFWGLNWPAVKFMLTEMPPFTIRAAAFPMAALLLFIIAKVRGHSLRPAARDRIAIAVTGILIMGGFNLLTSLGQTLTQTSQAAIIAYTMPAMTAGIAAVFLGERLARRTIAALIIGMAGLAVLASEDIGALMADPRGPAIMVLAALSWALGTVALKSRTWSLSPLALTVWFFVASGVVAWALVLIFEPPWQQSWPSAPVRWTLIYHALGPMVICYALWTALVGRVSATIAAIATLLAPFVGVSSAVVLLGDPLTWQKVVALTLVLASISLTFVTPADEDDREPATGLVPKP